MRSSDRERPSERGCTIGRHTALELAPLLSRKTRLFCWNRCNEGRAKSSVDFLTRSPWTIRSTRERERERERFRFRNILSSVELSRFDAGCDRLSASFRRLRFDVFSRTPVAARSLSLTLEPYAGSTVTRTCTPRLIYERLAAPF